MKASRSVFFCSSCSKVSASAVASLALPLLFSSCSQQVEAEMGRMKETYDTLMAQKADEVAKLSQQNVKLEKENSELSVKLGELEKKLSAMDEASKEAPFDFEALAKQLADAVSRKVVEDLKTHVTAQQRVEPLTSNTQNGGNSDTGTRNPVVRENPSTNGNPVSSDGRIVIPFEFP